MITLNKDTLVANPPNAVSLPYDLPTIPSQSETNSLVANVEQQLANVNRIVQSTEEPVEFINKANIDNYIAWEKQIYRLNPGFSSSNTIMEPTVKR
jgi:hypothetical protein